MFNKKLDNEILDELKKLNNNMEENNELLHNIWDDTNRIKVDTQDLLHIDSGIRELNNLVKVLLDIKTDNKIENPSEIKGVADEKPYNLKYPYQVLDEKPSDPMYSMTPDEEDNDLLNSGKYKSKYNVIIKSNEIDLDKVDWGKSYLIINYKGMSNYRLTLKQNGRSFSKFSDIDKDVELYKFKTLVLYIDGKYIDIDLNLYEFDDNFKVVDEDSGEVWFYKKIEIDLDK